MKIKFENEKEFNKNINTIHEQTKTWVYIFYFKIGEKSIFINKWNTIIIYDNNYEYTDEIKTNKNIWNLAYEIEINEKDVEFLLIEEIEKKIKEI